MSPSTPNNIDVNALMRGLVHELRNPLSAILTAASLLHSGEDLDEESAMLLDVVQKESRRMNRILTEFSSFVKPPASHPETFDLAKVLRDIARDMKKEGALGSHIEVRDELPAELPIFADPIQSYQAFHHIFNNAVQAMEHGGLLLLSAKNKDGNVIVILEDNGVGLSEATLERVFQPFFSTKPTSTGLGLSIASGLLQASGGSIAVENRDLEGADLENQHRGARVLVHLPRSTHVTDKSAIEE